MTVEESNSSTGVEKPDVGKGKRLKEGIYLIIIISEGENQ